MQAIFQRAEEATQSVLLSAGFAVPISVICGWSDRQIQSAENYAAISYYQTFVPGVALPPLPACLAPYKEAKS